VKVLCGFGQPMGREDPVPMMLLPSIPTMVWGGNIRLIGRGLGLEIDEITEEVERLPLEQTVDTVMGQFEKGTQGAFWLKVIGKSGGRERIVSYPDPFGYGFGYGHGYWPGRYGYWGRGYYMGWHDPWLWGGGGYDTHSYTVYTSYLDLDIRRSADGQSLFEGLAQAHSRNNELPLLVPNLVEAMFTGFPGNSGETVRITVDPERQQASSGY